MVNEEEKSPEEGQVDEGSFNEELADAIAKMEGGNEKSPAASMTGDDRYVDPASLQQMEEAAVVGMGRATIPGEIESEEQRELEEKFGAPEPDELPSEEAGDEELSDRLSEEDREELADDLEPLDNGYSEEPGDAQETEEYEGIKGQDFIEQANASPISPGQITASTPAVLTFTFYPDRCEISAQNAGGLSNTRIQRALQRVYRKMHEIRNLERYKAKHYEVLVQMDKCSDPEKGAALAREADAMVETIKNIERSVNRGV